MDHREIENHIGILGHGAVLEVIRRQWETQGREIKLLLMGESHIGKQTVAHRFLKSTHCDAGRVFEPCNVCHACRMLDRQAHPDHRELDGSIGMIRMEAVQELIHWMSRTSEDMRTILINDVHQMTGSASNAFLKILEEPPARSMMMFVSSHPERLLPTFRSRVQSLRMYRVPYDELHRSLPNVPRATLHRIAGRPGLLNTISEDTMGVAWRDLLVGDYHRKRRELTAVFGKRKSFGERSLLARNLLRTAIEQLRSVMMVHLNVPDRADGLLQPTDLLAIAERRDLQSCNTQIRLAQQLLQTLILNIHPELVCEHAFLSNRLQPA